MARFLVCLGVEEDGGYIIELSTVIRLCVTQRETVE